MRRTCSTPGCVNPPVAREMCRYHYNKWRGQDSLTPSEKIGVELGRAISARGTSAYAVAKATGLGVSTVHGILRGKTPRYTTAVTLADHLQWDRLVNLAIAARTRTCPVCDKLFMSAHEKMGTYCTPRCRTAAMQRRYRDNRADVGKLAKYRLTGYQDAVTAFCKQCEPDHLCRDQSCALRPVSPLPFVPLHSVKRRVA